MNKMCRSKIITTTIITAALLVLFGKGSFFTKTVYAKGENNVSGQTALAESDGSLSGTCGEGLTWTLENGTLTISGTGKMTDYVGGNHAPWYNDRNNINKVVICDGVTSIGAWAFWQCESLTSISIPEGVTRIEHNAFDECTKLTSINIPKSVTGIGEGAFYLCRSLTSISIPEGVTSIEPYTFWTCYNLKSITIPSSMNSIAASAFEDCTDLETVYYRGTNWDTLKSSFPSGVTLVTTFTISDIDDQTYDGATYNPDPTVEFGTTLKKDEDYTLSFERKNGSEWEAVTDAIDVGTYRVKVAGVSGTDYADMTEYKEFSITQKSVTITARDDSKNYDGDELTNSSFTYTDLEAGDDHCFTVSMTADSTITDAGTQPNVIATVDGEAVTTGTETSIGNYLITTVNGTLTVDKKNVTVKAQDKEFTYDGNAHSWPEYDVTGLVGTDSIEATVTGSISSASQSPVENVVSSYKFTSGKPENYIVTTENGQLTMKAEEEEAPKIEVEAPDKESTENAVARIFFSGIKVSQKNGNFRISWDKTEGVSKYEVYMTYCGSQYSRKPVATTTNNKVTVKKLNGKKLNLKKNIKIYVAAYDSSGNNVGKTVSSHISGKDRSKYTNPKEIKLTTKALSLTAGETAKIKATVKLENKKKKVSDGHAAQFRYASTNPAIATVDKNGTVTAIASGNCTIYVYAVNGLAKTVTVTVK